MHHPPVLSLRDFGIAYGDSLIIGKITLDIPTTGVFVLLGPAGTGKSTR